MKLLGSSYEVDSGKLIVERVNHCVVLHLNGECIANLTEGVLCNFTPGEVINRLRANGMLAKVFGESNTVPGRICATHSEQVHFVELLRSFTS